MLVVLFVGLGSFFLEPVGLLGPQLRNGIGPQWCCDVFYKQPRLHFDLIKIHRFASSSDCEDSLFDVFYTTWLERRWKQDRMLRDASCAKFVQPVIGTRLSGPKHCVQHRTPSRSVPCAAKR